MGRPLRCSSVKTKRELHLVSSFHRNVRTLRRAAQDVMAARSTGWAMLFANSVQEVMDFALIAQAGTLEARVPFMHIFDGFRTSHEVQKIEKLTEADIRALIDEDRVREHRQRGLTPDRPVVRGTAQNPDVNRSRCSCGWNCHLDEIDARQYLDAVHGCTGDASATAREVAGPISIYPVLLRFGTRGDRSPALACRTWNFPFNGVPRRKHAQTGSECGVAAAFHSARPPTVRAGGSRCCGIGPGRGRPGARAGPSLAGRESRRTGCRSGR
jgi:hypothetical protein